MNEVEVYILSEQALADVIDQIEGIRWQELSPGWFQTGRAGTTSLREIVKYHAYDTAWVPDVLAGRTIEAVGTAHDGDLLGEHPGASYRRLSELAIAAARALEDPDRTVHLSYGDFPAREYLKHISSWRTFRAHDIAGWIGADATMPPALVLGMWNALLPEIESWRQMGVFPSPVPVPEDAPLQDRLLGMAGRDPAIPR